MYLLAPFIQQNFKRILRANPELWGCAIFGLKMAHSSSTKFFWYKPLLLLSSTYWPFSMCKILQKFLQRIQSYKDASFLGPKWFICPKQFFLEKKKLSFASAYWPLSFCKIFKKFLEPIQSYEDVPFSGPKWPICPEQFFGKTIIITFIYLLALFIVQNLKKFLQQIQSYEDAPFLGPKWSICPKQIFFWKIINIILIYLLAPFIVQNF